MNVNDLFEMALKEFNLSGLIELSNKLDFYIDEECIKVFFKEVKNKGPKFIDDFHHLNDETLVDIISVCYEETSEEMDAYIEHMFNIGEIKIKPENIYELKSLVADIVNGDYK